MSDHRVRLLPDMPQRHLADKPPLFRRRMAWILVLPGRALARQHLAQRVGDDRGIGIAPFGSLVAHGQIVGPFADGLKGALIFHGELPPLGVRRDDLSVAVDHRDMRRKCIKRRTIELFALRQCERPLADTLLQRRVQIRQHGFRLLALDILRYTVGGHSEIFQRILRQGFTRKHRDDTHAAAFDQQWVAGERHKTLSLGPFRIADLRVVIHRVREMRELCRSDPADFFLTDRHARVGSTQASVRSGAGLQFQHVFLLVQCPNPRKGRVEM
ncbi:MAG: hypothetical protein WD070_10450, partial [Pirellulaceae bacterium]